MPRTYQTPGWPEKKRCADCRVEKPLAEFPGGNPRYSYCKGCNNRRNKESIRRLYGSHRHYRLKDKYGVGASDVDSMIEAQGGLCAVCGRRPAKQVDHDHKTGRIRGILCLNCNAALGAFKDDIHIVNAAIGYLYDHGADDEWPEGVD